MQNEENLKRAGQQAAQREEKWAAALQRVDAAQIGDVVTEEDMAPILRNSTWKGEPLPLGTPVIMQNPAYGTHPAENAVVTFERTAEGWKRIQ
jgi:hypothetical protein